MKKIIILIVICLLTSGCYDYKEINNLAFISGIGIDYKDDKYQITLEVLNHQGNKDEMNITTYLVEGESTSLAKAIENAANKITKQANYTHVKLMVISKSVAQKKLESITDFFLRSTYFRENFYIVSSLNNTPKEILENVDENNQVASTAIIDMLESDDYAQNSAVLKSFDKVIEEILSFGMDTCFSNILLKDNNFELDGIITYKDYSMQGLLNNHEAMIYNVLRGYVYRPIVYKKYGDKDFSISIATSKIDSSIKNNKINISGNVTGKIMNNEPGIKIGELKNIEQIDNDFTKILNDDIKKLIQTLQTKDSDILGIKKSYYQKTRKKDLDYWQYLEVDANITFKINKRGLIYEVNHE